MKLVLLFFCAILAFVILVLILFITSSIKLNVKKINISNIEKGFKKQQISKEFLVYIELCLFGKLKIAKIKVDKKLLEKFRVKKKIENVERDIEAYKKIKSLDILKALKARIDKVNLEAEIGTEDVMITVFLVTLFSSIIRNNFRKYQP